MKVDKTILYVVVAILIFYAIMKSIEISLQKSLIAQNQEVENFDTNEYHKAMRSFGRTSDLNGTVYNARCNPNGIYYVMRYSQPSIQFPQYPAPQYPYTFGYYNACGNKIAC